jgi:hypothetical protein
MKWQVLWLCSLLQLWIWLPTAVEAHFSVLRIVLAVVEVWKGCVTHTPAAVVSTVKRGKQGEPIWKTKHGFVVKQRSPNLRGKGQHVRIYVRFSPTNHLIIYILLRILFLNSHQFICSCKKYYRKTLCGLCSVSTNVNIFHLTSKTLRLVQKGREYVHHTGPPHCPFLTTSISLPFHTLS